METAGSGQSSNREPLAGLVERVTFHNADNGFCVLRIKARGHRELVTVLGAAPSIAAGEYIQASGTWENHREHEVQFRATFLRVTAPTSAEGMEKYLGSGLIKGIGPTFAQRLVSAFSETERPYEKRQGCHPMEAPPHVIGARCVLGAKQPLCVYKG